MKKHHYLAIFVSFWGIFCLTYFVSHFALGAGAKVSLNDAPYKTIYRSTIDNLVLDFNLALTATDELNTVVLKNTGLASFLYNIKDLNLWLDAGPAGFQGEDVDQKIGQLNYIGLYDYWYLSGLKLPVKTQNRLFVTIDSYTVIRNNLNVHFQISALKDTNQNKLFDLGDEGIFLASGNNGPKDVSMINKYEQVFTNKEGDELGPKIMMTNLFEGNVINNPYFEINIFAYDQGVNGLADLFIIMNGEKIRVSRFVDDRRWIFNWQDMEDGDYQINLEGIDTWDNITITKPITIKVKKQFVDLTKSEIKIDQPQIRSSGLDYATVEIKLVDETKKSIANRPIKLQPDASLLIHDFSGQTDNSGHASFLVSATVPGVRKLLVIADNKILANFLIEVIPSQIMAASIGYGDLIKGTTQAVYYLGSDNKRYVFPNLKIYSSWYADFSKVKTITNDQLAKFPIGGNVTYKPARQLVKLQTNPNVYAVDQSGTLRLLSSEKVAQDLYGNNWAQSVEDIPDPFWVDYKLGQELSQAKDFDKASLQANINSISIDKKLY